MNSYSKKERLAIYKDMLGYWRGNKPFSFIRWVKQISPSNNIGSITFNGFCFWLSRKKICSYYEMERVLPELWTKRPLSYYAYWFPPTDKESRITLLEELIDEMET